jgi:predicted  nucleic acid-binding Zn-ribbon protein
VAAVKFGSCTGCKTSIPSTYAPRLRAVDQVVRCENCRRIMYLPPGESPFRREDE